MSDDLKRLADAAESLERQAGELKAEVERLAEAERQRATAEAERAAAAAEPEPVEQAVDDSEARIVAFSMVLDGQPRDEVAKQLADDFGLVDSDGLLDDLYRVASG